MPQKISEVLATSSQEGLKDLQQLRQLLGVVERAKYVWESTFDAMANPVIIVDKEFSVQRANLAFAGFNEKQVKKVIGQKCYEVFAKRNTACENCPMLNSKLTGNTEKTTLHPFLDSRQYEAISHPLKGKNQDLDWFILQYHDIREEKELQNRLIQSEKMAAVGLLAGGVAHEINNPLGIILAFTELALKASNSQSQIHQDLKEIESAAMRAKQIVESLLDFSRSSSGFKKEKLSMKDLIEHLKPLIRIQAKAVLAKVEFVLPVVSAISAHRNQIEQVIFNLISNAAHALEGMKGKITLRLMEEEEWVILEVQDNGCGIDSVHLSKIFDPFFTTKKAGLGTGLGLSITYGIIESHAGKIECVSEVNQGTLFRVFFPKIGG